MHKMLFFLSSFAEIITDRLGKTGTSRGNRLALELETDEKSTCLAPSSRENRSASRLKVDGKSICVTLSSTFRHDRLGKTDIIVKWKQKDSQIATRK
ncbi:hypothetical protein SDJN02_19730, partial [Cucurbita argyrosperma subsp. argyrosperma]